MATDAAGTMDEDAAPAAKARPGPRIEGGLDAVVVGAGFEGLAAAAMLGKAGLKTALLAAEEEGGERDLREFSPGFFAAAGPPVVDHLDPQLVAALDLYRHGLAYCARRLDTQYFFSDGASLKADGDLYRLRDSVAAMAPADADAFVAFSETALDAARALRPLFDGADAPAPPAALSAFVEHVLHASTEEALDGQFADEHLKAMLAVEAALGAEAAPGEPFTFLALLRRWAGEAAGLQGAIALPAGGAAGVYRALRRAAQAARVDFRLGSAAVRLLVEGDCAAGVELADGGQIRASVVVAAMPARRAFLDMVGPRLLDIEFQRRLSAPVPRAGSARIEIALAETPPTLRLAPALQRRLVYAPSRVELRRAFAAARAGWPDGDGPAPLILDLVAPSVHEEGRAPAGGHLLSGVIHPVPLWSETAPAHLKAIADVVRLTLERMAPGAADLALAVDVTAPAPAAPPVLPAWARAHALSGASGVSGYYFCGPEALTGHGLSGAAGRRAAQSAIRHARGKAAAA